MMNLRSIFPYFILLIQANILLSALKLSMPERRVLVHDFLQCPGKNNLPIQFNDIVLSQTRRTVDINGKLLVKKDLPLDITANVELNKCSSKEDISTCEYYTRVTINKVCDKFSLFKEYMRKTTMPTQCPILAGEYIFNHTTIDTKTLEMFPIANAFWKVRSTAYDGKKRMLSCVDVSFTIDEIRKRMKVR